MTTQDARDAELVGALIPHWFAVRRWAKEILSRAAVLHAPKTRRPPRRRGPAQAATATPWPLLEATAPDLPRLKMFAEKQLDAGNLSAEYAALIGDDQRFARAARAALARPEAAR